MVGLNSHERHSRQDPPAAVKGVVRSAGAPVNLVAVLGNRSQSGRLSPVHAPAWASVAVPLVAGISVPRARWLFQRRLNDTRHIPAPGALVPNQTCFVLRGGDTHDFDHLNRLASRASRHILGMNSHFLLRHERSPIARGREPLHRLGEFLARVEHSCLYRAWGQAGDHCNLFHRLAVIIDEIDDLAMRRRACSKPQPGLRRDLSPAASFRHPWKDRRCCSQACHPVDHRDAAAAPTTLCTARWRKAMWTPTSGPRMLQPDAKHQ
jgi:hypothetical protein